MVALKKGDNSLLSNSDNLSQEAERRSRQSYEAGGASSHRSASWSWPVCASVLPGLGESGRSDIPVLCRVSGPAGSLGPAASGYHGWGSRSQNSHDAPAFSFPGPLRHSLSHVGCEAHGAASTCSLIPKAEILRWLPQNQPQRLSLSEQASATSRLVTGTHLN